MNVPLEGGLVIHLLLWCFKGNISRKLTPPRRRGYKSQSYSISSICHNILTRMWTFRTTEKGWRFLCIVQSYITFSYLRLSPCPVTVTTRIIAFLVGDPELNLHLPLESWEGGQPNSYHGISSSKRWWTSDLCWPLFKRWIFLAPKKIQHDQVSQLLVNSLRCLKGKAFDKNTQGFLLF